MLEILNTVVTIIYVLVAVVLILVVLLQAGRGGGLGSALGGGASQSVFGGGGGADFLSKMTQGLAAAFMVGAVFLAYASSHTGSSRLQEESEEVQEFLAESSDEVDYERIGRRPLPLPTASEAEAAREAAANEPPPADDSLDETQPEQPAPGEPGEPPAQDPADLPEPTPPTPGDDLTPTPAPEEKTAPEPAPAAAETDGSEQPA